MRHTAAPVAVLSEDKVPLELLAAHMRTELAKMRHMFSLQFYVICTSLLVLLLCIHRVSFILSDAPLYYQLEAMRVFRAAEFRALGSPVDFFPWLRQALVQATADSTTGATMRVLNVIPLRQLRDIQQSCEGLGRHWDAVDSLTQHYMMQHGCILEPEYDSMPPTFGRNGTFHLASTSELQGFAHVADFHNIDDPTITYQTIIRLRNRNSTTPSDVVQLLASIDAIEADGWIDQLTTAVVVDAIALFEKKSILVVVSFIMERTTTGMFTTDARSKAFRYFNSNKGIISLDVLIFLGFTAVLFLLGLDLAERYQIQVVLVDTWRTRLKRAARTVGIWEVFTLALAASILTVTGMRFQLWRVSGDEIDSVQGAAAFNMCIQTNSQYERIYELYCVSLVLIAFRLFYAFRYIAGLNKITNTLRASAPDLGRVLVLWIVLLIVFTISGCMIFGRDVFGMRTFPRALSFLMTVLVSAELDNDVYRQMLDSQGYITDVYLVTLFIIFWLVLLNLVIALISNAFLASETSDSSLNAESITDLLSTYVFFANKRIYAVDRLAHEREQYLEILPPTQRVAYRGVQLLVPLRKRLGLLAKLRAWRMATYLALLKETQSGQSVPQGSVSYRKVLQIVAPHEALLSECQLSGPVLLAEMFASIQRGNGSVLHSVNESRENYTRMLEVLASISESQR
jgi:hypothetical protein